MKRVLLLATPLALLLTACGAAATPTIDSAQIQASAVAIAGTMIGLTQAAIPTATPVPPTPVPSPTPLPSPTLPLPTLSGVAISTGLTPGAGGDPCAPGAPYKPLDPGATGPNVKNVEIDNMNKGSIALSLYLNKTEFGECGGRGFSIGGNQSINLYDLKSGCYSAFALVSNKTPSHASGAFCMNDQTHKWDIKVYADRIVLVGP
ncbi:MAG: hypothetical protein ACXWNQ_06660 [Anaerolineales bacterium]